MYYREQQIPVKAPRTTKFDRERRLLEEREEYNKRHIKDFRESQASYRLET